MQELISLRKTFSSALALAGEKYKKLVVLHSDAAPASYTAMFEQKFPSRHFNFGLSQGDIVDTAAGLALAGKLPVVLAPAVELLGALQQIRNSVCYANLNVKFFGEAFHQILEDFAIIRVLPSIKVFCPADSVEMKKMIPAILEDYGPAYVRIGAYSSSDFHDEKHDFHIGKGSVLTDGDDVGIIAVGSLVASCMEAAAKLKNEGISVRVVNMSSIQPLDFMLVEETAHKVKTLVVAEDHQVNGGLASAVADTLSQTRPRTFHHIGIQDLDKKYKFDAEGVYQQIRKWYENKS